MATVKEIFNRISDVDFKVLLDSVRASNRFLAKEYADITNWRYCDVVAVMGENSPLSYVSKVTGHNEKEILGSEAGEFMSFLRFIIDELKKLAVLEEKLKGEGNKELTVAGIEKLEIFGATTIYNAISPDPRDWDEISQLPYHLIWTKLMIDKTNAEIQRALDASQANKIKK